MEKPKIVILPPNEIGQKEKILFIDGELVNILPEPGPRPHSIEDNSTQYFGIWDDTSDPNYITRNDIISVCDPGGVDLFDDGWLKYKYNGKYLYIAKKPLRYSVSWDSLYLLGAIYGTPNDPGPYSTENDYDPREIFINQDATITKNNFKYKIRMLTGGNKNPVTSAGGEWNKLITTAKDGTFDNLTNEDLHTYAVGPGPSINAAVSWCQETTTHEYPRFRLTRGSDDSSFSASVASNTSNIFGWRPVLELIETINIKKI